MPLPPYLISSASSHAHHALLVKLDAAESAQAADAAVQLEVGRCRGVLAGKPSWSKVSETLIILQTCATVSTLPLELDFALLPAIQLAEAGRSHRRTGYRYLIEHLPRGHELGLMLINTIRKDLASTSVSHILMALHAICGLPGDELAPAVEGLLVEKRLTEHDVPAVRQRTIQALRSLGANLSLKDLARRIRREDDPSVLASVVKAFADALDEGAREQVPEKRRRQFDTLFAAAAQNLYPSPLLLQLIRALTAVVKALEPSEQSHAVQQARALCDEIASEVAASSSPWANACLLESCYLVTALHAADRTMASSGLLDHLRSLLLGPRDKGKAKARVSSPRKEALPIPDKPPNPNTRVLVLRCFAALPAQLWQEGLEEAHMSALMGGVDSPDSTTRRETLRLLAKVDPSLPTLTLRSHLQGLADASLTPDARNQAATRALEAAEIAAEGLDPAARGRQLAEGVASITTALSAHARSVWMPGVHAAISYLSIPALRAPFIDAAADALLSSPGDATLAVVLATLAVEYDRPSSDVVPALLAALPQADASVQELIVIALVPLQGGAAAIKALNKLREGAISHIVRRCGQVVTVLERGMGWDVVGRAKSRALNDVLDALLAVHAEATRPSSEPDTPTASAVRSPRPKLRYNYDRPGSPLSRASELAMGRSTLVEAHDVALDDLSTSTGRVRLA